MKKTETSSFGVSKRESHDSSKFYNRNLYNDLFSTPLSEKEMLEIKIPEMSNWTNKIYCDSSEMMSQIPDNSIGLAFTSPPYNVGKEYDDNSDLTEYLGLIERVGKAVYRVLRPGGRYVVNIANIGRKPYIPLSAFFTQVHIKIGFLPMGEIIWQKAKGSSGSCAWGSYKSAKSPRLRDIHEYLLILAKQGFSRPDRGISDIDGPEFMQSTLSVWNISPESAKRIGHPAPFPVALASRVIRLYSYINDVILDPFVGSGTTCVAAYENGRQYVGFDISKDFCNLAEKRLANTTKNLRLVFPD